jgi:hypothetical protein
MFLSNFVGQDESALPQRLQLVVSRSVGRSEPESLVDPVDEVAFPVLRFPFADHLVEDRD